MYILTKKAFPFGGRLYMLCTLSYTIELLPPMNRVGGNNNRCNNKV